MGVEAVAGLLTPKVLIALGVAVILSVTLTVWIFMYFTARTARVGIQTMGDTGGKAVAAASDAVRHLADKGAETLRPVASGIGNVLDSLAGQIRTKQDEMNRLATREVELAQEVERLCNRRIETTEVETQLKLALLEISQQYYSFDRHEIERTQKEYLGLVDATRTEYLGLQRATFLTQVGLDLNQLRFAIVQDAVLVYGLRDVRVIGVSDLKVTKLLGEVRRNTLGERDQIKEVEVLLKDDRLQTNDEAHHARVMHEAQGPKSIEHWGAATAKFGLGFLQACLGTSGLRLKESDGPLTDGMNFQQLCSHLNELVQSRIEAVEANKADVANQRKSLEVQVLQLLEEAKQPTAEMA